MRTNRRQFLTGASALAAGLTLPSNPLFAKDKAAKSLNILFLGGTGFIGPHMVRGCLERGHKVTLFNRGKRNTHLFPGLETIVGDRDPKKSEGLKGLAGRKFDAVVDTSGYVPRHVDGSAELMADLAPHYLFISTVAVYTYETPGNMDEDAPLEVLSEPGSEEVGKHYGGLKVLCEEAVKKYFPRQHTILRPTYIIGPGDHTDRFIHYIDRPMQGGRMAMPGPKSHHISFVDVRDLADHTVRSLENINPGVYNIVNRPQQANWGEYMEMSLSLSKADIDLIWMDPEFLMKQEGFDHPIDTPFPMWLNPTNIYVESQARAVKHGFSNRPFRETVIDTFNWWMQLTEERHKGKRQMISAEFENKLLAAWDAYKK